MANLSEIPPFRKERERMGHPTCGRALALCFFWGSLERIRERLLSRFRNDALVVAAEKFLQTVGVHGVLPGHVRDSVRRNRGDVPLPQELQDLRSEEHTSELQSLRHLVC